MKNKTYEFPVTALQVALGIIFVFAVGIAIDRGDKSRCKYTAMEKHYSADDIIKLCGR